MIKLLDFDDSELENNFLEKQNDMNTNFNRFVFLIGTIAVCGFYVINFIHQVPCHDHKILFRRSGWYDPAAVKAQTLLPWDDLKGILQRNRDKYGRYIMKSIFTFIEYAQSKIDFSVWETDQTSRNINFV